MPYESDPIAAKLNDLVADQGFLIDGFDDLSVPERALFGTWELVNEVYNGGFLQYFHNSSAEHAEPMVDVLRAIGAPGVAGILSSAIALVGPGTASGDAPNFLAARQLVRAEIQEEIVGLERRLYEELDRLHLQLFRYLARHLDEIDAPDDFWTEAATR